MTGPRSARRILLGTLAATAATAAAGLAVLLIAGDALCSLRLFAAAPSTGASMDGMAMPGAAMPAAAMPAHGGVCPILLAACAIALLLCLLSVFALFTGAAAQGDPLEAVVASALRWLRLLASRARLSVRAARPCWHLAASPVVIASGVRLARRRPSRAPPLR